MTLTARPGLAILFVVLAALALSLSGPPAQAQDGSVSDQDEEPDVSYVTVVVDRTPEPSVAQFTVTWNDAHEGKCSTQYNAYLVDYFVDTEDVHLGSATSDDVQIVKTVDSSGMDNGLGYRVNMVCGDYRDTDDYRYVSWLRLLGGLPSGTYSSEPALIGLVVDSGSLEPAFHQYKFSYVVDDVPASRERITVTATAKDGLYSIVFVEGHVRWTGQGCGASGCQFNYDNESREELDTLEDVDADTPGFQLDLEEGQTDFSIHVHPLVDGGNVYQFSVTSSTPAPTPEPTPTPTPEPTPTPTPEPTPTPTPLTAGFQDAPDSHEGTGEGTGAFTFRIAFSEPISISYVTLRDDSLDVTNGSATKAKRMNGQSDLWQITVEPDSDADVTVVLPITENCAAQDAVCTRDNKKLSNRLELTVPGPEGSGQNSPATGAPTVTGTAQVGETLTAETSGINDADGLSKVVYSYQWLANDAEITGATSSSYTLVDADLDKAVKVRVIFNDDDDNEETLTSEATATVVTPLTAEFQDAPDKHLGTGAFTFRIAFSEPISIGYVTLRDDSLDVTNGSATKAKRMNGQSDLWQITVEPDSDADVTVVLPITENCAAQDAVCTRDNKKLSNRLELTVPGPEGSGQNSPATGAPTVTGTAQVGETLTAETSGINDADGLSKVVYSYQWFSSRDTEIQGATDDSYTLAATDAGKVIRVRVTFPDDDDNEEALTSASTAAVAAVPPDAPHNLNVSPDDTGTLDVSWEAPASDGGSDITGYKVQWKSGSEDYDGSAGSTRQAEITDPASRTHTITGLTDAVEYAVRVIAVNDVGDGPPSDEATGTPRETTPPELSTATVDGAALTLTYDEALDEASGLAADAFSVTVGDTGRAVDGVSVSGSSVILTLGSAVASGATVTVSYAAPADTAAPRIQDEAGNPAASFSDQDVENNTPPPANSPATGAPTISGTVRVGETLTAETSGIDDADGMSGAVFTYQWLADDADIAGATSDTYTLVDDDAGLTIKVKVSFRDDKNNPETLTSAATAAVEPRPNSPATGAPSISGTVRVGETLTAETSAIADADGMSGAVFSYQWLADDADIAGATSDTYTLVDDDAGLTIKVKVSFRDDKNNPETLTSAATAAVEPRPNSPATGAPSVSGTVRVGETLTAETSAIADADGMSGAVFSYQWLANGADVAGATSDTYTPVADDVGKAIKVKVSFRDDRNHQESLTSAATAAVAEDPDAPTEPPNAPRTVRIVGDTNTSLTLTWDAPDGGTAVTEYRVQWLTVGEGFANARRDGREAVVDASARSHTITGLTKYGFYQVRVLAVNGAGESEGSNTAWGFPGLGEGQYGP